MEQKKDTKKCKYGVQKEQLQVRRTKMTNAKSESFNYKVTSSKLVMAQAL